MKQAFLFSHGFWFDKTARWMFTDIIESLELRNTTLFGYNIPTDEGVIMNPFFIQRDILQWNVDTLTAEWSEILLICHSQWCIIPTLLSNLWNIVKCIWITPPSSLDLSRMKKNFWTRLGVTFYNDGTINTLPRRDGTTTTIPTSYYDDYMQIDLELEYRTFLNRIETHIVRAKDDEILWSTDTHSIFLWASSMRKIDGNHDFTGEYREWLIEYIKTLI
jgi:hypothetical protein